MGYVSHLHICDTFYLMMSYQFLSLGILFIWQISAFCYQQRLICEYMHHNIILKLCSGIVGEVDQGKDYYIWTHKKFEIGYNENQVSTFVPVHYNFSLIFLST